MKYPRNWTVKSYTNDTWTTIVNTLADVSAVIIANTSGGAVDASIRLAESDGTERSVLMPTKSIAASDSETFEIPGFKVGPGDILQVKASATGVHFTISGEERQ